MHAIYSYTECYTEDEVRLVAGSVPSNGRVEYCKNGLWGSICKTSWDEKDAQVVCAQLGYSKILELAMLLCLFWIFCAAF